jgi:nicotinamidase/pyrazinamidase
MGESIPALPRRARWNSAALKPVFWSPAAEDSITGGPPVFFTIARRPDLLAQFLQGRSDMLDRRQVLTGLGAMAITAIASRPLWAAAPIKIDDSSALLVIDVQNCFLPGGSLAVKDGDQVVPVINRLAKGFANVVMTQDWHTAGHVSFASSHAGKKPFETIDLSYGKQVLWPDHCVQGTDGAALSKDLSIPQAELVIRKGYHKDVDSYSAFTEADGKTTTGLAAYLKARKLQRLFIAGLATDFCVAWTAMDARKAGFEAYVIEDGCRGIDTQGSLAKAWADMAKAGVKRIQSSDIAV